MKEKQKLFPKYKHQKIFLSKNEIKFNLENIT